MNLLIDIGNSRIKWSLAVGKCLESMRAFAWSADELDRLFEQHWGTLPPLQGIWVSNVAGASIGQRLSEFLQRVTGRTPDFVRPARTLGGITNSYREPTRLGVDRLVAMVAAYHRYGETVCVVDCGTALTVDLVDASGTFRGGVIAPGTELMRRALSSSTGLPMFADAAADGALALTTETGIAAGCLRAVAGAITTTYEEFSAQVGVRPKCILTGGAAMEILPLLSVSVDHEPSLILIGLAILSEVVS